MKEYTGTCYIGIVGSETEPVICRNSIQSLQLRPGDSNLMFVMATKGYEARQRHMADFLASEHDFIFMMDHDMVFPADALEKLRSHQLPLVSGYYLRRQANPQPIMSVWTRQGAVGEMPMIPFTDVPEAGKLIPIGSSGWGCMLIHREVVEAVQVLLKGEPLVIEDDLDIYPYDLGRIMEAIKRIDDGDCSAVAILREEIRPLRVKKDMVGSDVRFPFYARLAGYELMGDPDVRCGHMIQYPITAEDYSLTEPTYREQIAQAMTDAGDKDRAEIAALVEALQ